jgi:hypothetical protein
MNEETYLYRRQFVLGPTPIPNLPTWSRLEPEKGTHLAVHPDLPVLMETHQGKTVVLLGYLLDPQEPSWTDKDIIHDLVRRISSADDVIDVLNRHCGRFALIVRVGGDLRIFHDPGALRQIHYHIDSSGKCWCASQPTILANHLGLSRDEDIAADFKRSPLFSGNNDYWFPGGVTLFKGVKRLPPNHYLDLRNHREIRYWPKQALMSIPIAACVPQTTRLLTGILRSAANRYKLGFGISSGLDSRLLLAASQAVAKHIQFFTQKPPTMRDDHPDVAIPRELMQSLGLKHKVLIRPDHLPVDFFQILKKNVMAAKEEKGINAFSILKDLMNGDDAYTIVYGNLSEISKRDRFRYPGIPKLFWSGAFLAECVRMTGSNIALRELTQWLHSVKGFTAYNINALDLMHWEHRVGSWAAMSFSEYDIAVETICPYNCRKYIELMLSVPFRYRTMPDYRLHHAMINYLWPEVLDFEIRTVSSEYEGLKKAGLELLYRTPLYDVIKYVHMMGYRRFRKVLK